MTWNEQRSRERVAQLLSTVPQGRIRVENFATTYRERRLAEAALRRSQAGRQAIDDIPYDAVVVTDGVHVYANLLEYDRFLEEAGRESEAGSRLLLEFVHLHYSGMDRLIEAVGAQRVDHHGGRVHAVVVEPAGPEGEGERVQVALTLAAAMRALVGEASAAHQRRYGSRIRVGVESGVTLAVNSGRRGEPEPLFIGDAANLAAKLADGDEEGVAVGVRAREVIAASRRSSVSERGLLLNETAHLFGAAGLELGSAAGRMNRVEAAFESFRVGELAAVSVEGRFGFFRHPLPLGTIDFAALSPSRTARQESASIFADLAGFTRYVHDALDAGDVAAVVSNLHVLRGEMAAVLRDFGGRKIRFIGDCVHGMLAEGSQSATNEADTVRQVVRCAGALRSSFELCQRLLPGIDGLGLSIGAEIGSTPVTRLGIRGSRSVRCASSKAVTTSERVQRGCDGSETALGPNALSKAPSPIRRAFGTGGTLPHLDYEAAGMFASAIFAPAIARGSPQPAEPHSHR